MTDHPPTTDRSPAMTTPLIVPSPGLPYATPLEDSGDAVGVEYVFGRLVVSGEVEVDKNGHILAAALLHGQDRYAVVDLGAEAVEVDSSGPVDRYGSIEWGAAVPDAEIVAEVRASIAILRHRQAERAAKPRHSEAERAAAARWLNHHAVSWHAGGPGERDLLDALAAARDTEAQR